MNFKPQKRLGQNFLIDKKIVKKIIKEADLKSTDIVLEIGPGLGALTKELVKKVKQVIACEKDPKMCQILKESLKNYKNIEIINGDVLKFETIKLFKNLKFKIKNYKTVSNLPFYITAPVIKKFLELPNPPKEMVLMVQKEVAQRICASPAKMNLLAVSVQFYAAPKIISYVSKKAFKPRPKVDAAIIKISKIKNQKSKIERDLFFRIAKAGFSHPRKQLVNNLLALSPANGLKLDKQKLSELLLKNNIQPTQRAETLALEDWIKLLKMLK